MKPILFRTRDIVLQHEVDQHLDDARRGPRLAQRPQVKRMLRHLKTTGEMRHTSQQLGPALDETRNKALHEPASRNRRAQVM